MAYAKTVTVRRQSSLAWVVTITETGAGAADEAELIDTVTGQRPPPGWLHRVIATRSSGTAATRQPRLATAAAATTSQIKYEATATAVATKVDDASRLVLPVMVPSVLLHRSQPDAGNDNAFVTIYELNQKAGG